MIAYLRGTVHAVFDDQLTLDVGGVGYQVFCTAMTLRQAGVVGSEIELNIETQVRDDGITLFGFQQPDQMAWFRRLQKLQGVGARLALSILSTFAPLDLQRAISAQDKAMLTRAPGVGGKLAQRILVELRDFQPITPGTPAIDVPALSTMPAGSDADAVSALVNLGYPPHQATAAVMRAKERPDAKDDVGWLVTQGLRELAS